jgi:hypothetical protein
MQGDTEGRRYEKNRESGRERTGGGRGERGDTEDDIV